MSGKQTVSVRILTERYGFPFPFPMPFSVPDDDDGDEEEPLADEPSDSDASDLETASGDPEPERSEFFAEGRLVTTDDRVDVVYEESVLTGMEGSVTSIGFFRSDPSVVTMLRQGFVDTAFVFEAGKRHICVYQTPFATFELCVHALAVRNDLLTRGEIELDYLTEIHGARTERCKMKIFVE